MPGKRYTNPGCNKCKCSKSTPTNCPLTINLKNGCTNAGISGATITIRNFSGTTIATGSTDGSGNYTFPNPSPVGASTWFMTYMGQSTSLSLYPGLSLGNCTTVSNFCYRDAKLTVKTPDDTTATVAVPSPFTIDTGASMPGSTVMTFKRLGICDASPFPVTPCFIVGDTSKYIPNCGEATVDCGDDKTITINNFDYSADYFAYIESCDMGCAGPGAGCGDTTFGEGPDHRGVFPKVLFVTLTGSCIVSFPANIRLTWNPTLQIWDSGCVGATGTCCNGPTAPNKIASTRIIMTQTGPPAISFSVFSDGGCVHGIPECNGSTITVFDPCQLTAPVNISGISTSAVVGIAGMHYTITQ